LFYMLLIVSVPTNKKYIYIYIQINSRLNSMLQVLPVALFFSSVVSVLFHFGIMQLVVRKVARVMQITMTITAAESVNAAANIFLGQVGYISA